MQSIAPGMSEIKKGRIIDPALSLPRYRESLTPPLAAPSIFSAACTFGPRGDAVLVGHQVGNAERSIFLRSAQASITNR